MYETRNIKSEADQTKEQTITYKGENKPGMFYIMLLQTMIKWNINSSVTDTKVALDPILFTPKLNYPKRCIWGWNQCPAALYASTLPS